MRRVTWGIAFLTAAILTGCATTVSFQGQRPPNLDTLGIQRLAVMPFKTSDNSSLQRQAATWLTSESLARIQATNHFTIINSSQVEQAQANNGNVEALADALFGGQIQSLVVRNSTSEGTRKDKEGNEISYTIYQREVEMAFSYHITRTRDGSMLGPITKNDRISSQAENWGDQMSPETMVERLVKRNLSWLDRDVAPYRVTESRELMKETSKDKAVKQRAKDAMALVKAGSLKSAQNAFLSIYQDTGSFAAGYNVGVIIEAQGDMEGAHAFLQRLYSDTGNPKARDEMSRIERAMNDADLFEAYRENQSQRDKVIALMVNEIPSQIRDGSKIAVINNSRNEREIAEIVTNGIINGLQSKNITIVDRSNRALTEAEKNYQLSGNVSDDDIVSIGHEAGINVFVLVSVTGSGGSRRLALRLLDVERNTILYQSPQTDEMNL